jgi:hypothetical protein
MAEFCIAMARGMLSTRLHRYGVLIERAGLEPSDVAVMSVEDLFEIREGTPCFELVRYFGADDRRALTPEETLIHLRRLQYVKVMQTISVVAGEADPEFGKILRLARDAAREERRWHRAPLFNDAVLHLPEARDACLHLPPMPEDILLHLLSRRARSSASIKELMTAMLEIVAAQHEYRKALSLSSMCIVLRDYFQSLQFLGLRASAAEVRQAETWQWDGCKDEAVAALDRKLVHRYVRRGQLDETTAEGFLRAARALLDDSLLAEPRPLFHYYQEQFPASTPEAYRANGRTRFEYVMAMARELFCDICKRTME